MKKNTKYIWVSIVIKGHSCPKTVFLTQAGGRDVLGVAYFGPEAG